MAKKSVKDLDLKGKKVLVRADFNVPMKDKLLTITVFKQLFQHLNIL